jgi:hypothetical protein
MNKSNINLHNYNQKSTLQEFIRVYENVLPDSMCDLIVDEYLNSQLWKPTVDSLNTRTCMTIPLSIKNVWEENNYEKREKIDISLFNYIQKAVSLYYNQYEYFICKNDSGYDLLRYSEGEYCSEHIDSSYVQDARSLSCSLLLNDNYEGGEFCFFNEQLKYKLKKGSALMFPSNYMYPHKVLPVTRGVRYSIITWFF